MISVEAGDERKDYIHITPEVVAIFSLKDCDEQLRRANHEKLRLAQAVKSAHLAAQSALTAALAGSMSIGAHSEELKKRKQDFFKNCEEKITNDDRVMAFKGLLCLAMNSPFEWSGERLKLDEQEQVLLDRLCSLRDGIEHPKQVQWAIPANYILEMLPTAVRTAVSLLEVVAHHLDPGQIAELRDLAVRVETHCRVN